MCQNRNWPALNKLAKITSDKRVQLVFWITSTKIAVRWFSVE